jgi:hypothetical protein
MKRLVLVTLASLSLSSLAQAESLSCTITDRLFKEVTDQVSFNLKSTQGKGKHLLEGSGSAGELDLTGYIREESYSAISEGKVSQQKIARVLGLSVKTVDTPSEDVDLKGSSLSEVIVFEDDGDMVFIEGWISGRQVQCHLRK